MDLGAIATGRLPATVRLRERALVGMIRWNLFHPGAAMSRIRGLATDSSYPEYLRKLAESMAKE